MSALVALFSLTDAPVAPDALDAAMEVLAPYGPDGRGTFASSWCTLGHHHLAVGAHSVGEVQPHREGSLVVVADAILDDRDALCASLGIEPAVRSSTSDGALILAAYRKWGRASPIHLLGDYAFVVTDLAARTAFIARDHIGARPLYLHRSAEVVIVASDVRAVLAFAQVDGTISEAAVAYYLARPALRDYRTFYRAIEKLKPAHALTVRVGAAPHEPTPYWRPGEAPAVRYRRVDDYAAHLREILERAIGDRVASPFPVGSHVSGGLDSCAVAALAARRLAASGRPLDGFAWAPPVGDLPDRGERDERHAIEAIAEREGFACRYGTATACHLRAMLQRPLEFEGTTDLYQELPLLKDAAEAGVRVMLSGWGGDEAFSFNGRGLGPYLLKRGRLGTLLTLARAEAGGLRRPLAIASHLWSFALTPLLPDPLYARATGATPHGGISGFLSDELAAEHPEALSERTPLWRIAADPHLQQVRLLQNHHLAARMETWASWAAPHRIVYRYPLTDRRILDFALAVPPGLQVADGARRSLARAALKDAVPGALGKFDAANEALRRGHFLKTWSMLRQEARRGRFDGAAPWIDLTRLRHALAEAPQCASHPSADLSRFVAIYTSVRAYHLWERQASGVSGAWAERVLQSPVS